MRPASMLSLVLLLVAACAGARASSVATTPARTPEAELRALDSLWAHMYAAHDTTAAQRLYADDVVFTTANGRVKTTREEMDDVRPHPGLVMDYFRTVPSAVRVAGDSGFVSGAAAWRFTMDGQPREVRRGYEGTYLRGGPLGWRIVRMRMIAVP